MRKFIHNLLFIRMAAFKFSFAGILINAKLQDSSNTAKKDSLQLYVDSIKIATVDSASKPTFYYGTSKFLQQKFGRYKNIK